MLLQDRGSAWRKIYQHYIRLKHKDDLNDEVRKYMRMALQQGNKQVITG